ncbi:MAG: DEAD/DEAH box helicase [Thermofilaceae archaeon]
MPRAAEAQLSYERIFKLALARGLKPTVASLAAAKIYEIQRKSNWAYDTGELLNYICDNLDKSLTDFEQRAQVLTLLQPYLSPEPLTEAEENAMFLSYARQRYAELREKAEIEGLAPEEEEELRALQRILRIRPEEPGVEWTELLAPHSPSTTVRRVPRRAAAAPAQKQLVLRPYQLRALEAWRANGRRGVVVMPTGAGKTFVALAAAAEALQQGESVLVLVPTRILKLQWEKRVREYLGDGAVQVEVYNTAIKHRLLADLVIVDEVHHAHRGTRLYDLLQQHGGPLLGLTATPESVEYPIVYVQWAWELLGRDLAQLKLIVHTVTLEPELAERYEYLTNRIRVLMEKLETERERKRAVELEREFQKLCAVRRMVLSASPRKHAALAAIIAAHARAEKVLVWVESIKVAELLRAKTGGLLVHHKMPPSELAKTLERWGRDSNILYACRMLDEGVDVPDVRVGVIVASGAVLRRAVQRVGRLLRPKEKPAICYLLVARGTVEERIARRLQEYYAAPQLLQLA